MDEASASVAMRGGRDWSRRSDVSRSSRSGREFRKATLTEAQARGLLALEDALEKRVVGQARDRGGR